MKKPMYKMCTFILILLSVMIVTGCGEIFQREVNKKPDDEISEAIYEVVGRKKVYYYGKSPEHPDDIAIYQYMVHDYKDENVLADMVEAANAAMKERKTADKIILDIREETPGAGAESVTCLRTYYESEDGDELYSSFQTLYIYGTERSHMSGHSPYDKISTYINLPDIKSLVVSKKIAQAAEDEGIDWYEIWPDLEYYEVLED